MAKTMAEKRISAATLWKMDSSRIGLCWSETGATHKPSMERAQKWSAALGVGHLIHFPEDHLSTPRDRLGGVGLICAFAPDTPLCSKVH